MIEDPTWSHSICSKFGNLKNKIDTANTNEKWVIKRLASIINPSENFFDCEVCKATIDLPCPGSNECNAPKTKDEL
jgi:hypothetical protein